MGGLGGLGGYEVCWVDLGGFGWFGIVEEKVDWGWGEVQGGGGVSEPYPHRRVARHTLPNVAELYPSHTPPSQLHLTLQA